MVNYRDYYGPSLSGQPTQGWSDDPQKPWYPKVSDAALLTGLTVGAVGAAGFIPWGEGRVGDYYLSALRAAESYSPGGILKTFQFSNFFSQFSSEASKGFFLDPANLKTDQASYISKLIGGESLNRVFQEGVSLREGKLFWGQGEEVALERASAIFTAPGGYSTLGKAWGRTLGAEITPPAAQIIGGKGYFDVGQKWARAWGGESVDRFNRLLAGLDTKLGLTENRFLSFAAKSGTGSQTFGRLALKYGAILPAAYMAYQTADWAVRETSLLNGTIFGEGITAGIAGIGVKANLLASQIASATGLQSYREAQEEMAPGSTSLTKLSAFPIMGALGGIGLLYGARVGKMAQLQYGGATASDAAIDATEWLESKFSHLTSKQGLYSQPTWKGKVWRTLTQSYAETSQLSFKRLLGKVTPSKLMATGGALLGLGLVAPFIPGALIPETSPDELEAIYSGRQEVAVRRGRWWEFGKSAWEGESISYFRPHWYPRMLMRAKEKSLWGEEASSKSPLRRWFEQEFTYNLEQKHYYDRPYPQSSLPFSDVPLIGPLLASTVGRVIKPPMLMHKEEWMRGSDTISSPSGYGDRIATELGETPHGQPISPFSVSQTIGEQTYRLSEMTGLYGFAATSVKEAFTGSPDLFDQTRQLESARRMSGMERSYWDLELGGVFGLSEAFRRLYPHRQRQIPLYNPIPNTAASWLPGPGERAPDFKHGDPFTRIPEGELRLPGKGYESRFPELQGIDPERYPLIHRWKILSDVAPYSQQYGEHLNLIRAARKSQDWTAYEEDIFVQTMNQIAKKKEKTTFQPYQYLSPMGEIFDSTTRNRFGADESSALVEELNKMQASGKKKGSLLGGYWEFLSHNAETAFDQMTPVSPGAKLVHQRTAIESYERTRAYGTKNAFWNHPYRDFIRPSASLVGKTLGDDSISTDLRQKRGLEEYFDILQYVKSSRLANMARSAGDLRAVKEFEEQKNKTLFGINPYTHNFASIMGALPRAERDYFDAFSSASTQEERNAILKMVPDNEKALYMARWRLAYADEARRAKKTGTLSAAATKQADQVISEVEQEASIEGVPNTRSLQREYLTQRLDGENYADWYRRTKLLPNVSNIPGPDWVGWHPSVNLNDIKLKVVQTLGEDMHEYDLWASDVQGLVDKPYIDSRTVAPFFNKELLSQSAMRDRIDKLLLKNRMTSNVFTRQRSGQNTISATVEQEIDLDDAIKGLTSG